MAGLKYKIVVITGSSSGIGAATAVEFAKHGAKLVISGRDKAALDVVTKQCLENGASEVESVKADLATDEGIETLVNATMKRFGTIHVLVNNAGAMVQGDLRKSKGSAVNLDSAYKLLLRAPWKLSGSFVHELIKNKGSIVNVSSIGGQIPIPSSSCYCVMKAGLDHMTKCMATELGMQGVRVNCVAPGGVRTNILRTTDLLDEQLDNTFKNLATICVPLEQKVISSSEMAQSILFLASEAANRITGVILPVDGGIRLASPAYDFAGSQSIPGLEQK